MLGLLWFWRLPSAGQSILVDSHSSQGTGVVESGEQCLEKSARSELRATPGRPMEPPGEYPTLYLNADLATARNQLERMLEGYPAGLDDLDDDAFLLVAARLPERRKARLPAGSCVVWLGWKVSNLRMAGSKPAIVTSIINKLLKLLTGGSPLVPLIPHRCHQRSGKRPSYLARLAAPRTIFCCPQT